MMKPLLPIFALAAVSAVAAIRTGPEIGSKLPNFEAQDQNGNPRKLSSLMGPKGAVLVIYRSADW